MARNPEDCELVEVFAENVRRHRLALGLSQEALAELAGVHRTFVGMVERREKTATLYTVERIAKALKVEPGALLHRLG